MEYALKYNTQSGHSEIDIVRTNAVQRLTALWALSEAALGGILHVFKIPFTGLFIGSSAVLLITLITFFSDKKGEILRATILVMIVKGLVSPHTPINSYAAVMLQGLLGELYFGLFKSKKIAAFLLGVTALSLSALQKFLVTTLVFGMNIWNSIDLFGNYVISQFGMNLEQTGEIPISLSLILFYTLIHIAAGILIGLKTPKLGKKIITKLKNNPEKIPADVYNLRRETIPKHKKRRFLRKISGYFLFFIAGMIMALSYIFPVFKESQGAAALIMIIRSIVIMGVWYFLIGPFLLKRVRKYLKNKQNAYSTEVQHILNVLPLIRGITAESWRRSAEDDKIRRFNRFVFFLIFQMLVIDFIEDNIVR